MFHVSMLQHSQMLVVRKEGKAHDQYNSFRSAFELLEAVGREPHDSFKEGEEDLPPLQRLEQRMQQQLHGLTMQNKDLLSTIQRHQSTIQQLEQQVGDLRSRLEKLE